MSKKSFVLTGVIGWPVAHSLSPPLHQHWIARYGLNGNYVPLAVRPENLQEVVTTLPAMGFAGWNVTVPHKQAILPFMDELDEASKAIGAVNTVMVKEDGTLLGKNTDAYGFMHNLKQQAGALDSYLDHAVVIGAGGAARAVIYGLIEAGAKQVTLTNRTAEKAEALAADMPAEIGLIEWEDKEAVLKNATLLVNTTTLGMEGHPPLQLDIANLPVEALVTDIVYTPPLTPLLKAAAEKGCTIVGGLGMLIHQAVPGFEAWHGITPHPTGEEDTLLLAR